MPTFFNPESGESFEFEPGQQPPKGWKPLKPIAAQHPVIAGGGCVLYAPGTEPRLFVNPKNGESTWVQFPYAAVPSGWLPLTPLTSPPPMTKDEREYFNPATGESYRFEPGQQPPSGWKPLKPISSPHPVIGGGGCVLYPPGREPRLYVNPKNGDTVWVQFPYLLTPTAWLPLTPIYTAPPMTKDESHYFNPANGDSFRFEPGQQPPKGWKPLKPIPPLHPDMPNGGCVLYPPGREPRLYVNPKTGETMWIPFPYFAAHDGWVPLVPLSSAPPMTKDEREYFNPATGESSRIEPGQEPPNGWKQLKPIPPLHPDIPGGGCVLYPPGREPRLYVNPKTGESTWVQFPYIGVQNGWVPLVPRMATDPDLPPTINPPFRSPRIVPSSSVLGDAWEFLKELPGAVADTFSSGEAYQSFAQGQHAAVQTLTLGYFGDPEARARELERLGFKRPDRRVEWIDRKVLGPIIGTATGLAVSSAAWIRLGGPTMQVAYRFQQWTPPFGHVIYGSGRTWVHAMGPWGNMAISGITPRVLNAWWILEGIPVLYPTAVTATGGSAWLCFTAAASAFVRGWKPW